MIEVHRSLQQSMWHKTNDPPRLYCRHYTVRSSSQVRSNSDTRDSCCQPTPSDTPDGTYGCTPAQSPLSERPLHLGGFLRGNIHLREFSNSLTLSMLALPFPIAACSTLDSSQDPTHLYLSAATPSPQHPHKQLYPHNPPCTHIQETKEGEGRKRQEKSNRMTLSFVVTLLMNYRSSAGKSRHAKEADKVAPPEHLSLKRHFRPFNQNQVEKTSGKQSVCYRGDNPADVPVQPLQADRAGWEFCLTCSLESPWKGQ